MIAKIKFVWIFVCLPFLCPAQYYTQYFDGWDSSSCCALFTQIDTSNLNNIWQVGPPQKTIFNSSSTVPNVLVTDTIQHYPINNQSSFTIDIDYSLITPTLGILALQWNQKLDMETTKDGGLIEFSVDSGATWQSIFDNPYVYAFYGYDTTNIQLIDSSYLAFTGTDSLWRNIWLCFDNSYTTSLTGIVKLRFTFLSDTVDSQQEGWMIDNMYLQSQTILHTLKTTQDEEQPYLKVYPTPTTGRVHIQAEKLPDYHIIEHIALIAQDGRVVQSWGLSPTRFFIDIGHHQAGMYFLQVRTNKKTESFPIIIQHE